MMAPKPMLITGCSRGIGLELVKQFCDRYRGARTPGVILATCRNPDSATELREVAEKAARDGFAEVVLHKLDVTAYEEFPNLLEAIKPFTADSGLGLLINNAGVSPGLTRLTTVQPEQMLSTFNCNVVAPLMLTKALLPLLKRAAEEKERGALVVNMSSVLGSISMNEGKGGGIYPYRTSKAALNMVTRSLSLDLAGSGVCALSVHPGWVRTDMGGKNAPLDVAESVRGILSLLENFERQTHNGNFFDFEGRPVPW